MSIQYESIVPWGRSYAEYRRMFMLSEDDSHKTILGCGDGPASFNRVMHKNGHRAISIDPIYHFSAAQIRERIDKTAEDVLSQMRGNTDKFIWSEIGSLEELKNIRMKAMNEFLDDYEQGKEENRYIAAELPVLPFGDDIFELALSSHFLFLYSDHLSLEFHFAAIDEMLRVAKEVRIYPLVDLNAVRSPYLIPVMDRYQVADYTVIEDKVDYQFQKGADTMLRIIRGAS